MNLSKSIFNFSTRLVDSSTIVSLQFQWAGTVFSSIFATFGTFLISSLDYNGYFNQKFFFEMLKNMWNVANFRCKPQQDKLLAKWQCVQYVANVTKITLNNL